jgi:endogenous inhibitor of DNA gyrase (YacG/DUF329 family)
MRCPICGKEVKIEDPYMPFCSDRCRIVDLGNWASEKYRISTAVDPLKENTGPSPDNEEDEP